MANGMGISDFIRLVRHPVVIGNSVLSRRLFPPSSNLNIRRGAPKFWTSDRLRDLAAALDEIRNKRSLSVNSAARVLARTPQWNDWSAETIRKRYREGKKLSVAQ